MSLGIVPYVKLSEACDKLEDARRQLRAGSDPVAESNKKSGVRRLTRHWLAIRSRRSRANGSPSIRRHGRPGSVTRPSGALSSIASRDSAESPSLRSSPANFSASSSASSSGSQLDGTSRTAEPRTRVSLRRGDRPCGTGHHARPARRARARVRAASRKHRRAPGGGALLRDLDGYVGPLGVRCALRLAPLVFVRPGELRMAEWSEFNLDEGEWRVPAVRMKMRARHFVPLARQAVERVRELHVDRGADGSYSRARRITAGR